MQDGVCFSLIVFWFSIPFLNCSRQAVLPGFCALVFPSTQIFFHTSSISVTKSVCHILPLLDEEIQMKAVSFGLFRPISTRVFLPVPPLTLFPMLLHSHVRVQADPSSEVAKPQLAGAWTWCGRVGLLLALHWCRAPAARSEGKASSRQSVPVSVDVAIVSKGFTALGKLPPLLW